MLQATARHTVKICKGFALDNTSIVATVKRQDDSKAVITLQKAALNGIQYAAEGDLLQGNYAVICNNKPVAQVIPCSHQHQLQTLLALDAVIKHDGLLF